MLRHRLGARFDRGEASAPLTVLTVSVVSMGGRTFSFQVLPYDTAGYVSDLVAQQLHIEPNSGCRLLYGDRLLAETDRFCDVDFVDGCSMTAVVGLRSTKPEPVLVWGRPGPDTQTLAGRLAMMFVLGFWCLLEVVLSFGVRDGNVVCCFLKEPVLIRAGMSCVSVTEDNENKLKVSSSRVALNLLLTGRRATLSLPCLCGLLGAH